MKYLKAAAVGVATGLLAGVLWLAGNLALPTLAFMRARAAGVGGIGAVSVGSGSILLTALIGFIAGSVWTLRKSRGGA